MGQEVAEAFGLVVEPMLNERHVPRGQAEQLLGRDVRDFIDQHAEDQRPSVVIGAVAR